MKSLARWCFVHKFVVIGAWIAALVAIGGLNASAGSGYTDSFSLPGTESTTALNLLTDNFKTEATDTNQVVFSAKNVNDPQFKARIERTLEDISKIPHVARVDSPFAEARARSRSPRTSRSRSPTSTWTASSRSPTCRRRPTTS